MIEKEIIQTVSYFSYFSYAPSFEDIYTFLSIKTTKNTLHETLKKMTTEGLLVSRRVKLPAIFNFQFSIFNTNATIYALSPHGILCDKRMVRSAIAQKKFIKAFRYLRLLSYLPTVELVGISGGLAMANSQASDDIDLFIITSGHRLWTGRASVVATLALFGVRRKRTAHNVRDKLCCNLFFDASDLSLPGDKRNRYTAHEIIQMKPIFSKHHAYERFLQANAWVMDFFPNKKIDTTISEHLQKNTQYIGDCVEFLLKKIQLSLMKRHRTIERISGTQLWFFPKDFEKKLRKKKMI